MCFKDIITTLTIKLLLHLFPLQKLVSFKKKNQLFFLFYDNICVCNFFFTLSPDLLIFSLPVLLLLSRFILLIVFYHLIIECCYLCISYWLEFPHTESCSRMVSLRGKNHFLIEFRVGESLHTNLLLELWTEKLLLLFLLPRSVFKVFWNSGWCLIREDSQKNLKFFHSWMTTWLGRSLVTTGWSF